MCWARRRLASSIKGRFSSSVNNFHSAPVMRGGDEKREIDDAPIQYLIMSIEYRLV